METDDTSADEATNWRKAVDDYRRVEQRADAMRNPNSSIGTARDPHEHTSIVGGEPDPLDEDEIDQVYERGRYGRTVIDRPAKDSLRHGAVKLPEADRADLHEDADDTVERPFMLVDPDTQSEVFRKRALQLGLYQTLERALIDARLTGGAGVLFVTDDNAGLDEPVEWRTFTEVEAIHVFDRFDLSAADCVSEIEDAQYGQPRTYYFHPDQEVPTTSSEGKRYIGESIHHTRIAPYFGRRVRDSGEDRFDGWAQPVLEGLVETLKDMEIVTQAMASAVHEFQYDVLKIDGLDRKIMADGVEALEARMEAMSLSRSMINATALDAGGEDLESRTVDFSGPIEVLGLLKENLSLESGIPLSILFGQTPQGLSSNDETGRSNYFDMVRQIRHQKHVPAIERAAEFFARERQSPYDLHHSDPAPPIAVKWPDLREPTDQEKAETENTRADTEAKRAKAIQDDVKFGILSPTEAARLRHPDMQEPQQDAPTYDELEAKRAELRADGQIVARVDKDIEDIDTVPPKGAQEAAQKALRWREEHPDEIEGGTRTGWTRANQLARRESLSEETIGRMAAFERHRENAEIDEEHEGEPWKDAGYVAWLLWGGDTGISWAQDKVGEFDRAREDATEAQRPVKAGDGEPEPQRKSDVGYVNSAPSEVEQCDGCGWYLGDGECAIVRGDVAPTGWCRLWDTVVYAPGPDGERGRRDAYRTDPYSGASDEDLPDHVADMPEGKRRQWVAAFNAAWADYDDLSEEEREATAFRIANSTVEG